MGFSDINTNNPDLDDTSAAIRALSRRAQTDTDYLESWQRGINWLLSMQNKDGVLLHLKKIPTLFYLLICRLKMQKMQRRIRLLPI
ncbi:hypothetical protein AAAC51_20155 [Priestia megaterium]